MIVSKKILSMMRVSIALCLIFLFLSCKKNNLSDCTDDTYAYEILTASKIDTIATQGGFYYQVNSGNDLVFRYTHTGPDCKNIADEEYTEHLVFQVPGGATSFEYRNDQLKNASCYFNRLCYCPLNTIAVSSGIIKGTKISATKWDVEINIDLTGSSNKIILNKTFRYP
jgi:hypothetical protein